MTTAGTVMGPSASVQDATADTTRASYANAPVYLILCKQALEDISDDDSRALSWFGIVDGDEIRVDEVWRQLHLSSSYMLCPGIARIPC